MSNEPELHVLKFPAAAGADLRAERDRHLAEARRRYVEHLVAALPEIEAAASPAERAAQVLAVLTDWRGIERGDPCLCSCHPRLPTTDFHDYGFGCPCRKTAEDRQRWWTAWREERDAFWSSPEGQAITAREEAQENDVRDWLVANPGIEVHSHGGFAPEQWTGVVDGRRFYFRERHGDWRIELDLRPSGQFSTVWVGGDWDDETSFEQREIEDGDVIAEGTTASDGYGDSPLARLLFIVGVIRDHVARESCAVHTADRATTEVAFGRALRWCPACGADVRLDRGSPAE